MRAIVRVGTALGLVLAPASSEALEERFEDLPASVEVAGVFGVDVAQAFLTFQNVVPAQTAFLGGGRFDNQVTCRSNYGRPWQLQAQLISLKHPAAARVLPPSALQWRLVESTGSGSSGGGAGAFQPFSEAPVAVYTAGGEDLRGRDVILRFQYRLLAPPSTLAGTYVGQIVFTMTEGP